MEERGAGGVTIFIPGLLQCLIWGGEVTGCGVLRGFRMAGTAGVMGAAKVVESAEVLGLGATTVSAKQM